MKIATWNVNSIRAREERLLTWLVKQQPDIVCLQELKVTEETFPFEALRQAGYYAAVHGQKTYNGVAILARTEPTEVERGLGDDVEDPQARLIAATVDGICILSVYVPNGGEVGTEKYAYKLEWLCRLRNYLVNRDLLTRPLLLCGDFNIAPEERDVAHPPAWQGTVLFNPEMCNQFREILDLKLVDIFRLHRAETGYYSWWDYRQLGFPRNDGLRIDHILATRSLTDRCTAALIDREERKGAKPSDHAPVIAIFDWP
ncbi:MAG: exodeoxyribonuclease III [Acidobacteria bacterium]|nr:exodeoxyribonuclease III [Acidobacteriota bacterium]